VPYVPDWEPLANALKRVLAAGSKEQEAKADICNAVADKKIAVRVLVDESDPAVGGKTLSAPQVAVPSRLNPEAFDWVRSRPLSPWQTGPTSVVERYFPTWSWKPRGIALIELSTADVASVLCDGTRSTPTEGTRQGVARKRAPDDGRSQTSAEDAICEEPKCGSTEAASSPLPPIGGSSQPDARRQRGRKPTVRKTTAAKMLSDLDTKAITRQQLAGMLEKVLAERYGVSRDTARKARNDVLEAS